MLAPSVRNRLSTVLITPGLTLKKFIQHGVNSLRTKLDILPWVFPIVDHRSATQTMSILMPEEEKLQTTRIQLRYKNTRNV